MSEPNREPEILRPVRREVRAATEPVAANDEITFRDLFLMLWRGKWILLATMAATIGLVTLWMKTTVPLYTASMVIAPAGAGGMASGLSRYGDLASLVGIDLPPSESVSPFAEFTKRVTSVAVAERLQNKYGLLQTLFQSSWDAKNNRWLPPEDPVAIAKGRVRGFFGLPVWIPPSVGGLAAYLKGKLVISRIPKTAMWRMAFEYKDPELAGKLLLWIHKEADDLIREEAQKRATRQIEYIQEKLATVSITEHRQSLTQLLSAQEQNMMMTQVDLPFAARVIEPPVVSGVPNFPKPFFFLTLSVVVGGVIGLMLVFLVNVLRGEPDHARPH